MKAVQGKHPIQVVARRTGLTADVIRVWERRYGAVRPERTRGSRRLYSDEDVERLILLRKATAAGRRIGDVAGLDREALQALVDEDQAAQPPAPAPRPGPAPAGHLRTCLEAVERMDASGLESALTAASLALAIPVLLDEVVTPLLQQVGRCWNDGSLRVGHEHLAAGVIRSFLGDLARTSNMSGEGPALIVTTPAGQNHELGALMAAITAGSEGWKAVYLNPNLPAGEIAAAAAATDARAVALSITYPPDDPRLVDELRSLRRQLPASVALLVGGAAAPAYAAALDAVGATRLPDLGALRRSLETLRAAPPVSVTP
ncbi:MAG TPA: MerR family transcriptional regulator [Gammaproteobacteria bacterium]|nr:MerR family transcriptional regulator [Gammaproteobacteria bacterium]